MTALNILYGQSATQSCSNVNVAAYRGQTGAQIRCTCSSGGGGSVWGTNLYTDDSNICTAAVHAGVMTTSGGAVVLEVQPAQSTFIGTNRNGVTTSSYGAWGGASASSGRRCRSRRRSARASTSCPTAGRTDRASGATARR
nr:LCCL domain-containing protein [Myxococcus xanthus]